LSDNTNEILREISRKLDQMIAISKIGNREAIKKFREEIDKDIVSQKILQYADGSLSSDPFKQKIVAETKVSEATVKRRVSELVDVGALTPVKKGREIYYENSGLLG